VLTGPNLAAPDLRMTFAVRYAPRDVDSDGDGLVDKSDPCPFEAGPLRDTETPGCPDRAPEDLTLPPARERSPAIAPAESTPSEPTSAAPADAPVPPETPKADPPSASP
jgi:hypothetical protein